jgi:hypothetical protein
VEIFDSNPYWLQYLKVESFTSQNTSFLTRLSVSQTSALAWTITSSVSFWRCANFRSFKSRCYQTEKLFRHNNMHSIINKQTININIKRGLSANNNSLHHKIKST